MNQCDFDGLMEQQLFDFLVSDAENKYYMEGFSVDVSLLPQFGQVQTK